MPWRWRPGASSAAASLCPARRAAIATGAKDIAIPEYFALYNQLSRLEKRKDAAAQAYAQLAGSRGPASACIACGRCEQHCPQHIGIIQALRQVAQALETT